MARPEAEAWLAELGVTAFKAAVAAAIAKEDLKPSSQGTTKTGSSANPPGGSDSSGGETMNPRHARGHAGEQGMGFGYSQEKGWIFVEGPSGSAGHGLTTPGFDGVAYNIEADELHIADNKALNAKTVRSATALTTNLGKNLDVLIRKTEAIKDLPSRGRILQLLKQMRAAVAGGKALPKNTKLVVTGVGGQSQEVSKRLKDLGVEFRGPGTTDASDVPDDQVLVAAQKPLGKIAWERHHATLWAMTDPAGAIVRGGGGAQQAALARMNQFGDMAVQAVAQMNTLEGEWRQSVEAVRKAATQSAIDIKKVEAELPAMRDRRRKDENFSHDVNDYVLAMRAAEGSIPRMRKAEEGLQKAVSTLQKDELWKQANAKDNEVKDDEKAVAAKEAEIAEAKRIAHEVIDIAQKVLKADWEALAWKAIEFAADKVIDAAFSQDLSALKAQLEAAEKALKKLKEDALTAAVEASRHGVNEAIADLESARHDFMTALEQLAPLQTRASDMLKKSKSTAGLGVMFAQRPKQLRAIGVARNACERYGRIAATARKNMTIVANNYGVVGPWLDGAAKANPAFDRSKPYAKTLEMSALQNSVELGKWDAWINGVQSKCKESLAWLADTGAKGPMVHFERSVAVAKESLVDPG